MFKLMSIDNMPNDLGPSDAKKGDYGIQLENINALWRHYEVEVRLLIFMFGLY